jgi:hypothetical protein
VLRGAFLCIGYRGKLLHHKLIRVQCTKKSTRVPVSPVPSTGIRFKQVIFERLDLQPVPLLEKTSITGNNPPALHSYTFVSFNMFFIFLDY